jgi:hypothetical protein
MIPRLKTGGALASAINSIIDYLPRLVIQNTPDISASVTPRGQFVSLKKRVASGSGGGASTTTYPFKVSLRGETVGETTTYKVFVKWGTVNGQSVCQYPEEEVGIAADQKRVVLSVTGNFSDVTSSGVTNPLLAIEDMNTLLTAEEQADSVSYKIVLAYIMEDEGGGFTVTQQTGGHQLIGIHGG